MLKMAAIIHGLLILMIIQTFYISKCNSADGCHHCPDGWIYYQNSCYLFVDNLSIDWTEATHHCALHHSNLVTIESRDEDLFLRDFAKRLSRGTPVKSFYLGGSDSTIEGIWTWYTDDSKLTYTGWAPGQPDSFHGLDEDCIILNGSANFTWHDVGCILKMDFICEKRLLDEDVGPEIIG